MLFRPLLPLLATLCAALGAPASARAAPASHHVLVLIVGFADAPAPATLRYEDGTLLEIPLTVPNAEAVFFTSPTSTAARYSEMSHGDLTLTGDAIEVSVADDIGNLTALEWRAAADAAAVALGHDLSAYDRFGYLLASGFSGQGTSGAAGSDWFWAANAATYVNERTFNHEFGHTIGLRHAGSIEPDGTLSEYGDRSDFMGTGAASHVNAPNKFGNGWLGGNRLASHPLDGGAGYTLRGLADATDSLQVVSLATHGAHPDVGASIDTFVSFRPPIQFDQHLPNVSDAYGTPIRGTVHVHHDRRDDRLIRYFDRALAQGDVFSLNGTTIEVLSLSATEAEIDVQQAPYFPGAPIVSVDPVATSQVPAGTTVNYLVTVTNTDAAGLAFPAYYENSYTTPGPGWVVNWNPSPMEILVPNGATAVFGTFRVISPPGAAPGSYSLDLTLTNETGSAGPVSTVTSVGYEVLPPEDTTPPPPPSGLRGDIYDLNGDEYILLQWDPPADLSDVASYQIYRNGVALPPGGGLQTLYVDFFYDAAETNVYFAHSVDAVGNQSAPSDALVVGLPDAEPPAAPPAVAGWLGASGATILWDPAADNVGVVSYEIHRNGVLYGATTETRFTDPAPLPGSNLYTVYALDAEGNTSPPSAVWELALPTVPALPPSATALLALLLLAGPAGRAARGAARRRRSAGPPRTRARGSGGIPPAPPCDGPARR